MLMMFSLMALLQRDNRGTLVNHADLAPFAELKAQVREKQSSVAGKRLYPMVWYDRLLV